MDLSWYYENKVDVEGSIGIDEVGRGPLAGPVVAAAVWVCGDLALFLEKNARHLPVTDSKKMSQKQRIRVINWMINQSKDEIKYSTGFASAQEIDSINILNAALLAMERAYDALEMHNKLVLIDGNRSPDLKNCAGTRSVVRGDEKILSISLASIVAKEYRDAVMRKIATEFPYYGWETNVGYGSKAHIQAICTFGITDHHRRSFAPIKGMFPA